MQTAALLMGLRAKGETVEEVAGAALALRCAMVRLETGDATAGRYLRHRWRPGRHSQHLNRGGLRGGRCRGSRGQARQPELHLSLRLGRRAGSARDRYQRSAGGGQRAAAIDRLHIPVRTDLPPGHAACGTGAQRAGGSHHHESYGAAGEPCRGNPPGVGVRRCKPSDAGGSRRWRSWVPDTPLVLHAMWAWTRSARRAPPLVWEVRDGEVDTWEVEPAATIGVRGPGPPCGRRARGECRLASSGSSPAKRTAGGTLCGSAECGRGVVRVGQWLVVRGSHRPRAGVACRAGPRRECLPGYGWRRHERQRER